ncbi:MAG: hypothetical protein Q4D77_02370 [Peptostreptococcaceae bacterium]|nr:hypothetical protein [Peptostreptococcaceae bacterium]
MFSKKEFEQALSDSGKTKQDISNELGVHLASLYRKINGESDFFGWEIQKIAHFLDLDSEDICRIFIDKSLCEKQKA